MLLKDILNTDNLVNIKVASLLLNVMAQSSESIALSVISKFCYKDIVDLFIKVEGNDTLSYVKERLMNIYGLLSHCVIKWKVDVKKMVFYDRQNISEFLMEMLYKAFKDFNRINTQIFIIETLQFLSIINSSIKEDKNLINCIDNISNEGINSALILNILNLILKHNNTQVKEKVLLKIQQLPDNALILNQDTLAHLSNQMTKHLTSILFYTFQFHEPFSLLLPFFVQQVTPSEESVLEKFPQGELEDETELYKKLLEIELSEHRKDIETLSIGLMQAESEVRILKEQNLTFAAMVEALKKVILVLIIANRKYESIITN